MRIAFIADTHCRGKDLSEFNAQVAALDASLADTKPDLCCHLGDYFDNSQVGDRSASTGAVAEAGINLARVVTNHCPLIITPGDHDQGGGNTVDALTILEGLETKWPLTIARDVGYRPVFNGPLLVTVPWKWGQTNAEEQIAEVLKNPACYGTVLLIGHLEVSGLSFAAGGPTKEQPDRVAEARGWCVRREFLDNLIASKQVAKIALGNYHNRNSYFVGAFRQVSYGHEGEPQGYELWDSETGETTWVELDGSKRYQTIRFTQH